ncbi:hypothetical protein CVT26_004088 [Gymnopilus dilepis]|uniref:Uncharacterized protein n=1 Tax=Gymnopilus dilepis TaxID=231916 RepID=A0A409W263_9AGAR|nr:hypothetical protein CVT26_004088 [Gymnopilus dilepis]
MTSRYTPSRLSSLETFLIRLQGCILRALLDSLGIDTIISLRQTSSRLYALCKSYENITWDINTKLQDWFENTATFLYVMDYCGAIISGSFAVQFFDRTKYSDDDLDIYIRVGAFEIMGRWLEMQGYRRVDTQIDDEYDNPIYTEDPILRDVERFVVQCIETKGFPETSFLGAVEFIKDAEESGTKKTVRLSVVDRNPVEHILFHSHSSTLINIITSYEAISVFPKSSFLHRVSYVCRTPESLLESLPECLNKCRKRGFQIIRKEEDEKTSAISYGPREVRDDKCWVIKFPREQPSDEIRGIYGPSTVEIPFNVSLLKWESRHDISFRIELTAV